MAERFRRRNKFVMYTILYMILVSVITWFVLPNFSKLAPSLQVDTQSGAMGAAFAIAGWFKAFWVVCLIVAIGMCMLAKMGIVDPLLPLLNVLLVALGAATVGLCLFCYYGQVLAIPTSIR